MYWLVFIMFTCALTTTFTLVITDEAKASPLGHWPNLGISKQLLFHSGQKEKKASFIPVPPWYVSSLCNFPLWSTFSPLCFKLEMVAE